MATLTYNVKWMEAMDELYEQIHIEDPTLIIDGKVAAVTAPPSWIEAFIHWQTLYVKYIQILRKLEDLYDSMVHPQKRLEIKRVLEVLMSRIIELKHRLVHWNPPNPDVKSDDAPFPWEYVNFDETLFDLKLPPVSLETPIPRYFLEERASLIRNRDNLVKAYMNKFHGVDKISLEETARIGTRESEVLTLEDAISIIQRNERGRQGRERGAVFEAFRKQEHSNQLASALMKHRLMDQDEAAQTIQRCYRGYKSRMQARLERENELVFIGMKMPVSNKCAELESELALSRIKRKNIQISHFEQYKNAQKDLYDVIKEQEGSTMRAQLYDERMEWIQKKLMERALSDAKENTPLNIEDFGKKDEGPKDTAAETSKSSEKGKGKAKKEEKKKGEKGKKKKKVTEEVKKEEVPIIFGPTEITKKLHGSITVFNEDWREKDESSNHQQVHDEEYVKRELRPNVLDEIRKDVESMLKVHLENLSKLNGEKAKKGKDKKKKKSAKGKGGKGKKSSDKSSSAEVTRDINGRIIPPLLHLRKVAGKSLPGLKFLGKEYDTEYFLAELIKYKLINQVAVRNMKNFVGEFNYLGKVYENNGIRDPVTGNWIFQDPSIFQVKQNLIEYAILPLGSNLVKEQLESIAPSMNVRSILLYGPKGSGKTAFVEAVASEIGAMLINLSPNMLEGKFSTKDEPPAKLLHMVWAVATDISKGPVIIFIDEAEKLFIGGKKKASTDGPARFKKDFITYLKSLSAYDNVVIIGNSREPYMADQVADMRDFFDKFLYLPSPNYASRLILWKQLIFSTCKTVPDSFDMSILAKISDGYTAGSICKAVKQTLSARRVKNISKRPLREEDFVSALSTSQPVYMQENLKFRQFTEAVSGLTGRREAIRKAANTGEGSSGDKKKKKDSSKKKKK